MGEEDGTDGVVGDASVLFVEEQPYRGAGPRFFVPFVGLVVGAFLVHDLRVRVAAPGPVDGASVLREVIVPLLLMVLVLVFVAWSLRRGRMVTTVREDGVHVRFVPFHRSGIVCSYHEITAVTVKRFHPLVEYGGWGIRWGWRGKAYLAQGDTGVELSMRPRGSVMVGSQEPEMLAQAIQRALDAHRENHADPAAPRTRRP